MEPLERSYKALYDEFTPAYVAIEGDRKAAELKELDEQAASPELWSDQLYAQALLKKRSKLGEYLQPWLEIRRDLLDIGELIELGDESLAAEIQQQLDSVIQRFAAQKALLKYGGVYDTYDALLTISAGAGGTDAQDWAEMLERMYLRWAEKTGKRAETVDRSAGEEAGLKSVTLELSGEYAYGKLRGEHGVHRLVRLSPFNADNLRQTSFAKVEVVPVIDEPSELEVDEQDIKVDVYRSGGKGGQSVNTTDSAVRLTHLPTGIVVAIQNERSQLQNKEKAMQILRSRLAQLKLEQHKDKISELKGPNEQAAWGNQIRNYVLHPYKLVKDVRSGYETSNPDAVLDGDIEPFIEAYLDWSIGHNDS